MPVKQWQHMKIALVYDRINKFGGAERILLALHELWPDAPLFTAVYNPSRAQWADVFSVRSSFMQYVPMAKTNHELFPWLTPLAFESFVFDDYDCVISITSAEAKSVITKPDTIHVCYCLTPTRYLWSGFDEYAIRPGLGIVSGLASKTLRRIAPTLKRWDSIASSRPDRYVAISERVKKRIENYYKRDTDAVIYPPVDTSLFKGTIEDAGYYLVVSRLVGYKRVDLVIEAFNQSGDKLIVIGDGADRKRLEGMARSNITFIHQQLTDREIAQYYRKCTAFVFAADEDFGIVAAEAQSAGKPVIAYKESGVAEIVIDGKTGVLFHEQSVGSLLHGIRRANTLHLEGKLCQSNAERFTKERFQRQFRSFIASVVDK